MHLLILTLVINLLIFFQKEFTMINVSLDYIEHNKTITIFTHITCLFHLFVISNIFYHEGQLWSLFKLIMKIIIYTFNNNQYPIEIQF